MRKARGGLVGCTLAISFPWMEVFIESPAYIWLKVQDQPRENVHLKV